MGRSGTTPVGSRAGQGASHRSARGQRRGAGQASPTTTSIRSVACCVSLSRFVPPGIIPGFSYRGPVDPFEGYAVTTSFMPRRCPRHCFNALSGAPSLETAAGDNLIWSELRFNALSGAPSLETYGSTERGAPSNPDSMPCRALPASRQEAKRDEALDQDLIQCPVGRSQPRDLLR